MRQLGSASQLDGSKSSYKSVERDTPTANAIPRTIVSQSAPHTPVSVPGHGDGLLKSVPRLLSEPAVNARSMNSSPGVKSLDLGKSKSDRNSSHFVEKFETPAELGCDGFKSLRAPGAFVPVHSPMSGAKKESKFFLKSPLVKRETKVQIDEQKSDKVNVGDGTDV